MPAFYRRYVLAVAALGLFATLWAVIVLGVGTAHAWQTTTSSDHSESRVNSLSVEPLQIYNGTGVIEYERVHQNSWVSFSVALGIGAHSSPTFGDGWINDISFQGRVHPWRHGNDFVQLVALVGFASVTSNEEMTTLPQPNVTYPGDLHRTYFTYLGVLVGYRAVWDSGFLLTTQVGGQRTVISSVESAQPQNQELEMFGVKFRLLVGYAF